MYEIDYSDAQWRDAVLSLTLPDWLRDWSLIQVDRTQSYYISRIAQLGMQGERVLDAGCGMGNWSMGLARHYQRVDAIEIDRARLDVLKAVTPAFEGAIVPQVGSVHELPYSDAAFDGVFCNGVLFVTDYRRTLAEFRRVLKPGGQLYVTYCGIDWWKHLLVDRGRNEPDCVIYGANGLLHYFWCLLDKLVLNHSIGKSEQERLLDAVWAMFSGAPRKRLFGKQKLQSLLAGQILTVGRDDALNDFVAILGDALAGNVTVGQRSSALRAVECLTLLAKHAPEEHLVRLLRDFASRLETGHSDYAMSIDTWTFSPEEMSAELSDHGFVDVLSGREGRLNVGTGRATVVPIYDFSQGVFESLAMRAG